MNFIIVMIFSVVDILRCFFRGIYLILYVRLFLVFYNYWKNSFRANILLEKFRWLLYI